MRPPCRLQFLPHELIGCHIGEGHPVVPGGAANEGHAAVVADGDPHQLQQDIAPGTWADVGALRSVSVPCRCRFSRIFWRWFKGCHNIHRSTRVHLKTTDKTVNTMELLQASTGPAYGQPHHPRGGGGGRKKKKRADEPTSQRSPPQHRGVGRGGIHRLHDDTALALRHVPWLGAQQTP